MKAGLNDGNEWDVYLENDKIMISFPIYYDSFIFDFDDGYFLSENHGEFGGKIDFIGNDDVRYTVLECNPRYMFSINDDVYLLEGLSHYGIRGNLYKLRKTSGQWNVENKVELGGNPWVYTIDKGNIYIIIDAVDYEYDGNYVVSDTCFSKIIKITISGEDIKVEDILNASNGLTFANSMVKKGSMLYIGLRGGFSTVNLKNNEIKFYTKK